MKKIFFLTLFLFPIIVLSQTKNNTKTNKQSKEGSQIVKVEPVFGENHVYDYPKNANLLDSTPEYSEGAVKFDEDFNIAFNPSVTEDVKGKILIEFVIEKDGSLSHIKILRNVQQLGPEAVKTIQSLKKWKPATRNKKPVRTKYLVPIEIDIKANTPNEETGVTR